MPPWAHVFSCVVVFCLPLFLHAIYLNVSTQRSTMLHSVERRVPVILLSLCSLQVNPWLECRSGPVGFQHQTLGWFCSAITLWVARGWGSLHELPILTEYLKLFWWVRGYPAVHSYSFWIIQYPKHWKYYPTVLTTDPKPPICLWCYWAFSLTLGLWCCVLPPTWPILVLSSLQCHNSEVSKPCCSVTGTFGCYNLEVCD